MAQAGERALPGGLPFEILATTFSTLLEPQFVPFNVKMNGLESAAQLGDNFRSLAQKMANFGIRRVCIFEKHNRIQVPL